LGGCVLNPTSIDQESEKSEIIFEKNLDQRIIQNPDEIKEKLDLPANATEEEIRMALKLRRNAQLGEEKRGKGRQ
jgi:hypothetical protein